MTCLRVAAALLLCAACGAGAADVKAPADVAYNTDYDTAWTAVTAAFHERFRPEDTKVEDKESGQIQTKWYAMASSAAIEQDPGGGRGGLGGDFLMMRIRVSKDTPIRVEVDAEGAHKSPANPRLEPYQRHGGDEPAWVDGRIEAMRGSIYARLKQFAAPAAGSPAGAPEPPKQ